MLELSEIIEKTRQFVNELSPGDVEDDFTEETNVLIGAHVDAAVKSVAAVVPARYLNQQEDEQGPVMTQRPDGRWVMTVDVPEDCLRLLKVTCGKLKRPVVNFTTSLDPKYSMEWCEVPGIGSGSVMPSGYVWSGSDKETVEIHSVASNEDVQVKLCWIPIPALEDDGYNVSYELLNAVAYMAGALYLKSTGSELAAGAAESARLALEALGVVQVQAGGQQG